MTFSPQPPPVPPPPLPDSTGRLPGGLLALAILNFVFGGWGVLGGFWNVAMAVSGEDWPSPAPRMRFQGGRTPPVLRFFEQMTPKPDYLLTTGVLGFVSGGLLIVSGLGYLKRKRVMGRLVANTYVAVAAATAAVALAMSWLGLFLIPGLAYPVVTVILVNKTFKRHFVN